MKFNSFALALATIGAASAQSVRWLSPAAGATLKAGEPFQATVIFAGEFLLDTAAKQNQTYFGLQTPLPA